MKFMMTTVGLVDEDTLDSLHRRFHAMDTEGNGQITTNDIVELARRKKAEEDALQGEAVPGADDLDLRKEMKKQSSGRFM
jgi:Ca2+-binding EF-hand superfamily protein